MKPKRFHLRLAAFTSITATFSLLAPVHAATENWTGATNGIWGTNTNWSGLVTPDSTYDLTILGPGDVAGVLNINLAAAAAANSINFTNTAATTLTNTTSGANQTLTLGSGGLTTGTGAVTIGSATTNQNVNIALSASQIWNIGAGSLTATNVISGSGFGITKSGAGTLTLAGANTFSGGLTINAGTVVSTAAQGFGNGGSTVSIGAAGTATVTLGSDQNVNNVFTGTGIINVTGSTGTPNFNNASALNGFTGTFNVNTTGGKKVALTTAGGKIGSGATVNITSGGTLYIATTTASFDGVTFNVVGSGNTENLGAIRIETNSVIGATSSVVLGGDTSLGSNSGTGTINAAISQSTASGLTKVGAQTLVLGGNNSYTGATTLTAGTLSVSSDSAGAYNLGGTSGNNAIVFNGGTLQVTGTTMTNFGSHTPTFTATKTVGLDIANVANNFTISQSLNQTTGQLIKTGAGTLTLSGANTYSGGTRANAGTTVFSGSHTKAAGTTDFLSVNNVGAQNAVLKVTAGTQGFTDINLAEVTNARGAIYQSGGDLSAGSTGGGVGIRVGSGTTSYGYYSLSGGTLTNGTQDFGVGMGSGATGVMDVTGGSATTGSWLVLGRNGAGNGLLNVTGGSVTSNSNNIALNWANTAGSISILNVGGGAGVATVTGVSNGSNGLSLSESTTVGTTAVANLLTNGTLTVGKVYGSQANSTALLNFNGGTLKATPTNSGANFMNSGNVDAVTVYSGGTIDNNNTNITIGNVLGAATGNGVTSIAVSNGGSGYIGAPLVTITGGTGNTATGYAVMTDDGTGNGTYKVSSIVITSPGSYSVNPTTVTLTGGGATTNATIGTITTAANTSGSMTFSGSGTTTLSGSNTYTGATSVSAGTLVASNAAALGTTAAGTTVSSGAALDVRANIGTEAISVGGSGISNGGALITGSGSGTVGGAVTLTANTSIGGAGTLTVGGAIGDGGSAFALTKVGGGTTALTGANTYSGGTTIDNGTVGVARANGTNTNLGTGTVTVNPGAILRVGYSVTSNQNISTTANDITLAGGSIYADDASQHLSGNMTVSGSGGTLGSTYNAGNNTAAERDKGLALDGIVSGSGALTVQHTRINTGNNYNTSFVSFSNNSNTYSGTISINQNTTAAEGGVYLGVNGSTALQNATVVTSDIPGTNRRFGSSPIVFKTGLGSATIGAIGGSGALVLTGYDQVNHAYGADSIALTVGGNNASTSYSGAISGGGSLNKSGTGTLTLTGTNTYTGTTTVTGGTLALGAGGSIPNSSQIALNGGNFNVSAVAGYAIGSSQTLSGNGGSVTGDITVNGTLAIGSSPGTMTFDNNLTIGGSAISNFEFTDIAFGLGTYDLAQSGIGSQTVTFGGTLNLLFSGGTYADNSTVQIFNFENYAGNFTTVNFSGLGVGQSATFDSSTGFVTVVPEPHAALLGGIGMLLLLRRRRS